MVQVHFSSPKIGRGNGTGPISTAEKGRTRGVSLFPSVVALELSPVYGDKAMSTTPRRAISVFSVAVLLAGCRGGTGVAPSPAARAEPSLDYPEAPTVNQVDDYHGVKVADPYRWLEDSSSPQTRRWIEAENKLTFAYLDGIPERPVIKKRLTQIWNYERFGIPLERGGRYFYTRNEGLQNQSVLHVVKSPDGEPRVLLDPNRLSRDGTAALSGLSVSEDGRLLAYGISVAGSDWEEWKVRSVDTGADLPDRVEWVKFSSVSWTPDSRGFFYSRYDEPSAGRRLDELNYYQKLFYHRLGTSQGEDALVYSRPDQKEWGFDGAVTEDGAYLIISIRQGTDPRNRIFYKDLRVPDAPVQKLLDDFDASYDFVGNDGTVFWFLTDLSAPRGRLISVDILTPDRARWKELIPQAEETLLSVSVVHDTFIAVCLQDAHSRVKLFRLDGGFLRELSLPGLGTVSGFRGRRKDTETFYAFTSFIAPTVIYRLDLAAGEISAFRRPRVDFRPEEYETRQVFLHSKDGTRIPMFLNHRKGLDLDGKNPTILFGYGGFNASLTPSFSVANLVWMEMGGVLAVANIRGGGEYGEEWHQAGIRLRKQNVFDDFIAAAEWLIREKYTSTARLAILGGSNGGLLIGACMTQRPDLFGAALPIVGVMDMLRFHRFTIGWAWTSDFGSPDNPDEFKALLAYSPLHNVKHGTHYPATFITTADHDDRVVPAHSFKFAAALQAAQAGPAPVLIRIETRAGHGAGKPTSKAIDETADRFAFLVRVFGMSPAGSR